MIDCILHGDICYSEDKDTICTIPNGYVICIDGYSCGVYEEIPKQYANLPVLDYENHLILPGMVDLHIHAPQFAFRGMGMDMELLDWLNQQAFVEEAKYSDLSYAEKAYNSFSDTMRKSATTRACVFATLHKDATLLLMDKLENSGLISYVGKVNMDRNAPEFLCEASAALSAEETVDWIQESLEKYHRTKPIITPRFIPSCSDDLMRNLETIQKEFHLPVQSHLSENQGEIEWVKALRPDAAFYGEAYDINGLFGKTSSSAGIVPTIMAHCVWSGEEEVALLQKNNVYVAHCPTSNMNLLSGIAPIRKYIDAGLQIGLGSDVAGGHTESIFCAIADAIQVSKLYWRYVDTTCKPITLEEAFYLATVGGGSFFGNVGSFANGYSFDAVILDDNIAAHPQPLTLRQRLERAIYLRLDQTSIAAKFVEGRYIL